MTVKELKEQLNNFDENLTVTMQIEEEDYNWSGRQKATISTYANIESLFIEDGELNLYCDKS